MRATLTIQLGEGLRCALELSARRGGVTSGQLAEQTGKELAWAATRLYRCADRKLMRVRDGAGLRQSPLVYEITERGRRVLADPKAVKEEQRWTFDELLRVLGPAPF